MKYAMYESYKPSGVEWLDAVPSHWTVKAARFGYSIQLGKMLQPESLSPTDVETTYLKSQHVQWESVRVDDLPLMWASPSELVKYGVQDGDLLVCEGGDVGRAGIVKEVPQATIIQNALHCVRPRSWHDIRFLMYVLEHASNQSWFDIICNRSTIAHFTGEKFGALRVPSPPIDEQQTIARFLDAKTAQIDELIAKKRQLVDKLKEKRSALVARTVTRGLPPEAAKAAGLEPNPEMKPLFSSWIDECPSHWSVKPLKFVAKIKTGFAFSSDDFTDEGIPVLRIGDISRDGDVDLSDAKYLPAEYLGSHASVNVKNGDILMAMTGATIGKAARFKLNSPALLNQRVCAFRAQTALHQGYLWFILNSNFYVRYVLLIAFGGAQPNISDKQLLDCCVPVPPEGEQGAISEYLEAETSKLENLISQAYSAINRLTEYRQALITSAVTGKIDVRELA